MATRTTTRRTGPASDGEFHTRYAPKLYRASAACHTTGEFADLRRDCAGHARRSETWVDARFQTWLDSLAKRYGAAIRKGKLVKIDQEACEFKAADWDKAIIQRAASLLPEGEERDRLLRIAMFAPDLVLGRLEHAERLAIESRAHEAASKPERRAVPIRMDLPNLDMIRRKRPGFAPGETLGSPPIDYAAQYRRAVSRASY